MPLARIAPVLPLAVIVAEDGRFCAHHGVDLAELRDAIEDADDLADVRGGSTITQQIAKNLFLWPGRSFVRKALEFPLALWIDLVLPKRRILEIYLNIAEWGPNGEFGVEAGARYAFGKPARDLSARPGGAAGGDAAQSDDGATRTRRGPGVRRLAGLHARPLARAAAAGDRCLSWRAAPPGLALAGAFLYKPGFPKSDDPARSAPQFSGVPPWPCRKEKPRRRGAACAARPTRSSAPTYVEDKDSGELRRPHHIDLKTGMYKGRQVLKVKTEA